jgi:hypothetical protein
VGIENGYSRLRPLQGVGGDYVKKLANITGVLAPALGDERGGTGALTMAVTAVDAVGEYG